MGRPCEPFLGNLHLNENWSTKKPLQYRQDCQSLDLHQVSAPITDLAKKSIGLTAHTPLSHRIDRALKEYSESLPVIENVILFIVTDYVAVE